MLTAQKTLYNGTEAYAAPSVARATDIMYSANRLFFSANVSPRLESARLGFPTGLVNRVILGR